MNKNLKRALNTTAAVSMSLAMVLGAVAPVSAARVADSSVTDKVAAKDAYKLVEELYNAIGEDVYEAYKTDTFKDAVSEKFQEIKNIELQNIVKDNGLLVATATDAWTGTTDVAELVKFVAENSSYVDDADEDVVDFAKFLNGFEKGTAALEAAINIVKANEYEEGFTDEEYKKTVADLYKKITENEKYFNAVVKKDNRKDDSKKVKDFKVAVEDYRAENEDSFVKDYVRQLEDLPVVGTKTVYDLVEKEVDINYSNLKAVERLLKNIKADKAGLTAAKYEDVKDAEEVAAYIEGLEAIVEDMKEVKELLDDNADVEAYEKNLKDLVNELASKIEANDGSDAKLNDIDKAIAQFRKEDRTALKEFVEGFVEEFYTLTPKQLSSGKYVVRLENAEYGRYVDTDDVFTGATATLKDLLTAVIDNKESADTYYDELVEAVATVDELLKAVTTDIEGLTLDTKITSLEANKIIKAKKALNQLLVGDSETFEDDYKDALTRKEKKEILANKELIETLYFKLILNGEVTTVGWVETPQGWEYYDNNGKRVYEGWAPGNGYWSFMKNGYSVSNEWCAAKEGWYYMGADGKMVTGKVMINGVEEDFGTDGIWVRK